MQRSFKARLEALERLEVEQAAATPVKPPPPAYADILAKFDVVLEAIAAGKCSFWSGYFNSCAGEAEHAILWPPCQFVHSSMRRLGAHVPPTLDAYAAWIRDNRRFIAFLYSRTDDELEAWVAADGIDPLFYSPEQRTLADEYARLVGGDADAQLS